MPSEDTQFGRGISPDVGKRTQFGQPGGNKPAPLSVASSMREFYKWCESVATESELKAYRDDTSKPFNRRNYVKALLDCNGIDDFYKLTNQTHGLPKQTVEQETKISTLIVETK